MAKVKFKVEGMDKLRKDIQKLGMVPQKHVTSSARKGMNLVLRGAKAKAPYDTGMLKRGMKLAGERSRLKGKKVYRIVFDRAYNDVFQKRDASGKVTGYYPVSQEYGYFLRDGRYMPGARFIHDSMAENALLMEKTIVKTMQQKIDQEIAKVGLK